MAALVLILLLIIMPIDMSILEQGFKNFNLIIVKYYLDGRDLKDAS